MALDTVKIPNTIGLTFRTNINHALDAAATCFQGSDTPITGDTNTPGKTDATGLTSLTGALWFDTTSSPGTLKVHNGGSFVNVNSTRTDSEINNLITSGITGKANTSHTHAASDLSGPFTETQMGGGGGDNGQVLTAGSGTTATWEDAAGGAPGGLALVRTSGSGSLAVPTGINRAIISGCGGGSGFCARNASGSSSGSAYRAETTVTAGGILAWSVGAGGNGTNLANSGSSADGGDTTVNGSGASVTLQGGQGNNNDLNNSGVGPEGGTASGLTGLTASGATVNRISGETFNTRRFATYATLTDGAINNRGTGGVPNALGGAASTGGFLVIEWGA